jgi:hypothetical protein
LDNLNILKPDALAGHRLTYEFFGFTGTVLVLEAAYIFASFSS